jgi:ribosomal protein L37E
MLKEMGRERKSKQYVVCEECGKRIFLTEENTEKIAGITVIYCECGNEFEMK